MLRKTTKSDVSRKLTPLSNSKKENVSPNIASAKGKPAANPAKAPISASKKPVEGRSSHVSLLISQARLLQLEYLIVQMRKARDSHRKILNDDVQRKIQTLTEKKKLDLAYCEFGAKITHIDECISSLELLVI